MNRDAIIDGKGSVQRMYRPVVYMDKIPDVPPNDPSNKAYKWWMEQLYRCQYGWTAPDGKYITPYQYFLMNFVKIKPLIQETIGQQELISPYYRENDDEIFTILWNNTQKHTPLGSTQARNHVEMKARGIGWTIVSLFGIGLWTFVFRPSWPIGFAYPNADSLNKERLPFIESWHELPPIFRRWKGRNLDVINNSEQEFRVGWKIDGKVNHMHNTCRFDIIASEKAGVYKGDRLNLMIAVEAGLWEGNSLKNYVAENEPSIHMGKESWGICLIGGTSNMIVNKTSAYKDIYENPGAYRATRHFSNAISVAHGFMDYTTGKCNKDEALKNVLERRAQYADDPHRYQQELMENPLTIDEAFTPTTQYAYNQQVINDQIQYIKLNGLDSLWKRGKLYYPEDLNGDLITSEVRFKEDPDGHWLINLEGQPIFSYEGIDIAGIDDTFKGIDPTARRKKDASLNAMVVWRKGAPGFTGKSDIPVGVYLGHDKDMNNVYEQFLLGMRFWGVKQTLYEHNSQAFINFLAAKNELSRLYYVDGKPGIKVTGAVKAEQTLLGSKYFAEGRHKKNTSVPILEALSIWGGPENTDIGSALHLVFQLLEFTKHTEVVRRDTEKISQYIQLNPDAELYNHNVIPLKKSRIVLPNRRVV